MLLGIVAKNSILLIDFALEEMEKQMIREALSRHNSKKEVADELGIGIATLYRKIKKYELLNI